MSFKSTKFIGTAFAPLFLTIKNKKFDCSDGLQIRDFTYIDDVIDAIIKTLKKKNLSGEIINIGSGDPITIRSVILKICNIVGSGKPQFGNIQLRKDEIRSLYPSVLKAKKLLNWKSKIKLNLGLKRTVNYYRRKNY